jgi:hypothetical protein
MLWSYIHPFMSRLQHNGTHLSKRLTRRPLLNSTARYAPSVVLLMVRFPAAWLPLSGFEQASGASFCYFGL